LFVGRNRLDYDFVNRAVALFPDWSFHLFGGVLDRPRGSNLIVHGERPFAELIPYLRYADIGLQSLEYWPGAECFTDSLKMQQYTYCRLPIVAPTFLRTAQPHVFYYEPGDDESIRGALLAASRFDRAKVPHEQVGSWSDLIVKLAGHDMEKAHAA
jgi:2-beta-glucuronyltransferase